MFIRVSLLIIRSVYRTSEAFRKLRASLKERLALLSQPSELAESTQNFCARCKQTLACTCSIMNPPQNQMRVRRCQLGLSKIGHFEDSYPSIFMRLDDQ